MTSTANFSILHLHRNDALSIDSKSFIRRAIIFSVIRLGDKFSSKISPNIGCRLGNFVNYDSLSKICSGVHVSTFWKKLYFLLEHLVALVLLMTRCMNVV